ncbi:hypothetical protein EDB83DRAFT_2553854 [Lactarius deliciosus]|nr:hypothetical protein EDB83DRAFT_2553854 [Lactarius deliciosus]
MFNVPEKEQLSGEGWVSSFCKAYKLKEYRRHGEASSAEPSAIEAERKRMQDLMKKFAPQDRWNFDETSLFPKCALGDGDSATVAPYSDHGAWEILRRFAGSDMTLPQAEAELSSYLGNRYKPEDWFVALDAVMKAEGDTVEAQKAIQQISAVSRPPQLVTIEKDLMASVEDLRKRNRIFGELPTIDELTDPIQERRVLEDSPYAFPGGDKEIVEQVLHEGRVQRGEVIEVEDSDGDEDDDEDPDAHVTRRDAIALVAQLERLTIKFGEVEGNTVELSQQLRQFRVHLLHDDLVNSKQTRIDTYF